MAKAAAPSQDQLLELMQRAAEELKHAKDEARTAVLALQKEQAAHQKTEAELEQALKAAKNAKGQASADDELLKDQIEAERENGKALAERVKELEAALEGASAELKAKLAESETALSVAVQQEQAKGEKALEEQKKEIEEQKALVDDAAGKLVEMETQLNQEKEKHQATAQKLLEIRAKARELESSLSQEHERVKGLEAAAKQMADAHEKALKDQADANAKNNAEMTQSYQVMQQELANVTERWREVERQYEALHREMLLTLEQRDEARRLLDNERSERERLSKVLKGQGPHR